MRFGAAKCVFTEAGKQAEKRPPSPSIRDLSKQTAQVLSGNLLHCSVEAWLGRSIFEEHSQRKRGTELLL